MKSLLPLILLLLCALACSSDDNGNSSDSTLDPSSNVQPCDDGMAGPYPCQGYDLLGRVPLADFEAAAVNDIWGWTDSATGSEYAIVGLDNGVAFVDISDSDNLAYLGKLPTATVSSTWRDVKVYSDHTFIVSEAFDHGMQVFDLTRLRSGTESPRIFEADARYTGFGNAHNLFINEETGYAYVVGTARNDAFNGGVHFIDVQDPKNPSSVGGYGQGGYTHDAQVVIYRGPDTRYAGREIFVGSNEDRVVIVDVTDKASPSEISAIGYDNVGYTHQGWFTEDQAYFILGDEEDEINSGTRSRTLVFDFTDLEAPFVHHTYLGPTNAIDHNGYVLGDQFFLANYTAGLRVLDITEIDSRNLEEIGFFDSYPQDNTTGFNGVWSVYPYFESGKIILSDINSGLFVIQSSE
ncbi:MAG: choice-of-anchor B family protein [Bacteroidota bacterium]